MFGYYDDEYVSEYRSAIVDECGGVVAWCDNLSGNEIDEYLETHEEYKCECVCISDSCCY